MAQELAKSREWLNELRQAYEPLCATSEERELIDVVFALPAVKHLPPTDIRKEIIEMLGRWYYMSGATQQISDRELSFMAKFVHENYDTLNLKEMDHAMTMTLTGRLDVDPNTYGLFSPAYVARILNAYMHYKVETSRDLAIKKANKDLREQIERESKRDETDEDRLQRLLYFIRECKSNLDKNAAVVDFGHFVYDYLKRRRLMRVTQDEVKQAKLYAMQRINAAKQDGLQAYMMSDESEMTRYAREWCLRKFFQENDVEEFCSLLTINDL